MTGSSASSVARGTGYRPASDNYRPSTRGETESYPASTVTEILITPESVSYHTFWTIGPGLPSKVDRPRCAAFTALQSCLCYCI